MLSIPSTPDPSVSDVQRKNACLVRTNTKYQFHLLFVDGPLSALHRVLHQHSNGHRADASGNRSDQSALIVALPLTLRIGSYVFEVHISTEMVSALVRGIIDSIHADIDDDASLLDHVALHQISHAHRSHDDVRLLEMLLQIRGAGVADRHGGVTLQKEHCHGNPHDVAATDHHRILAGNLHAITVQKLDAAFGGARDEEGLTTLHSQLPYVEGMETIHVLLDGNCVQNPLLVDVLGKRELDQNSVNFGIRVQLYNNLQQLILGGKIQRQRQPR